MKLGAFTVMLPKFTPEQAAPALRDAGFDGIEWRVKDPDDSTDKGMASFWSNNRCTFAPTAENGRRARQIADDAGLEMPSIGTYIEVDDFNELDRALAFADAAKVGQMRLLTARWSEGKDYRAEFDRTLNFWNKVVPITRDAGVKVVLETHHETVAPSIELVMGILRHFDPADAGILFDPGNMIWEGYTAYEIGLAIAGDYLAHLHVKNAMYHPAPSGPHRPDWSVMKTGNLDFDYLFRSLRKTGYDGWMCIEDFGDDDMSVEKLRDTAEFLREKWDAAAPKTQG